MTESTDLETPEPTEADEQRARELQHFMDDQVLDGKPHGDERCDNCLYYLNPYAENKISYCWHPKIKVLVGAQWWCQWWEAMPE